MLELYTRCECGAKIKAGAKIGNQTHVKYGSEDMLYTDMTVFTPMECPKCGRNLGYIAINCRKDEEHV